jgi:hypothetical protein
MHGSTNRGCARGDSSDTKAMRLAAIQTLDDDIAYLTYEPVGDA